MTIWDWVAIWTMVWGVVVLLLHRHLLLQLRHLPPLPPQLQWLDRLQRQRLRLLRLLGLAYLLASLLMPLLAPGRPLQLLVGRLFLPK